MTPPETVERKALINAPAARVWQYLTTPALMASWMGDPAMQLSIQTDWKIHHPITITGVHHLPFINKGIVLQYEPLQVLQYTHLSSLSRLPDVDENYSIITFRLSVEGDQTILIVQVSNFPSETIHRHLQFYWQGTIGILQQAIEKNQPACLSPLRLIPLTHPGTRGVT